MGYNQPRAPAWRFDVLSSPMMEIGREREEVFPKHPWHFLSSPSNLLKTQILVANAEKANLGLPRQTWVAGVKESLRGGAISSPRTGLRCLFWF